LIDEESVKQGAGMKEFVEKAIDQLVELVVLLPAGGLLFLSAIWLWIDADIAPTSVRSLFGDSSTALVMMLIAASALGLLMFGWAAEGADAYLASVGRRRRWAVRLLHWMPVPPVLETPRVQQALRSMANNYTDVEASDDYTDVEASDDLERDRPEASRDAWTRRRRPRLWVLRWMPFLRSMANDETDVEESGPGPWRSVARFSFLVGSLKPRTHLRALTLNLDERRFFDERRHFERRHLTDDQRRQLITAIGSQEWSPDEQPRYLSIITSELDNLHLRVVLTLSVALAFAVIAIQVVLRLGIDTFDALRLPSIAQSSLIVIGMACVSASIGLRFLAGRLWREELELAVLLFERITQDALFLKTVRDSKRR
jgi:hypothetical protein